MAYRYQESKLMNRTEQSRALLPMEVCSRAFGLADLLVVLGVLAFLIAIAVPILAKNAAKARRAQCVNNLKQITRAVLLYADDYKGTLPILDPSPQMGVWWGYKELV